MVNARNGLKGRKDAGRDAGGFVALPWSVLDSPAYMRLSHPARSLLLEIARQYVGDNNGRLLASRAHLSERGWSSSDVITRGKRELVEAGFIYETVMGHRPNKASWYALTWYSLDRHPGFDPGAAAMFQKGAYRNRRTNGDVLTPSRGVEKASIAPPGGVGDPSPTPSHGAIRGDFGPLPTPSGGDHLEMPSAAASRMPAGRHLEQPAADTPTASWEVAVSDGHGNDDGQLKLEPIAVTLDWWARGARVPTAGQAETSWPTSSKLHADCARQCLERGVRPPTLRAWGTAMGTLFRADRVTGAHGTYFRGFAVRQNH